MKFNILYLLVLLLIYSCNVKKVEEKQTLIQNWFFDFENNEANNKKTEEPISGKYYVRVDSTAMYSSGLAFKIHDSLKKNWIRVSVSFQSRLGGKRFGQSVIITAQSGGNNPYYWYPIELGPRSFSKNKWFIVADSTQFFFDPKDTNSYELKVFGFNPYKFSYFDLDDLKVKVKKIVYPNNNI